MIHDFIECGSTTSLPAPVPSGPDDTRYGNWSYHQGGFPAAIGPRAKTGFQAYYA